MPPCLRGLARIGCANRRCLTTAWARGALVAAFAGALAALPLPPPSPSSWVTWRPAEAGSVGFGSDLVPVSLADTAVAPPAGAPGSSFRPGGERGAGARFSYVLGVAGGA